MSGDWALSLQRSRLDHRIAQGLERGTVKITQTDSLFTFRRLFVVGGKEDRAGYELPLDGTEKAVSDGPMPHHSKLEWEADALVLRERYKAPQGEATNTVHYRLLDNGRTIEAREVFHGPRVQYDNTWIFEKRDAGEVSIPRVRRHPDPAHADYRTSGSGCFRYSST